MGTRELIYVIACFVVPLAVAPAAIMGLRPLFALFLREGLELFSEVTLDRELSLGIAHVLALVNVIFFLVAWLAAFGCLVLGGTFTTSALIGIAGVVLALVLTMRLVRSRVGLSGWPAILVGLLTFTGGNLPLFLIVPVVLLFRGMA